MQKNAETLIKTVSLTFDRIKLSIPLQANDCLLHWLNTCCIDISGSNADQYWPGKKYECREYLYQGCKITVTWSLPKPDKPAFNPRVFVTVSDPNTEVQELLKVICPTLPVGRRAWNKSVLVSEVEVAYDLYGQDQNAARLIKKFIVDRIFMRGSRKVSVHNYKGTIYIACKGYVRRGIKGIRVYVKTENRQTFCRVEVQFNKPYFKKNRITVDDLPFDPRSFNAFSFIYFLEDFSEVGVKNCSRTMLRKQGIEPSAQDYNKRHRLAASFVKKEVLGGTRGRKKSVYAQIDKLASFNRNMGISIHYMNYFNELTNIKEVIVCLGEISIVDENASKRLVMVIS
ncbi:MAG: hypothetical protein EOM59_12385 [Clostridia bacterium]|nr:hypothetical protein [Clostridia bacterium]